MSVEAVLGIIALIAIVGVAIWIFFGSKKRQWYKVYLADNRVYLLYRDMNERWWRTNDRYLRFKDEQNREYTFPSSAHWILMMVAVKETELESARQEVENASEIN